jgi:DNA polymerase (family 10)
MRNRDVAEMLDRAARILALRGENRYRLRAYKKAARAVAGLDESIEVLIQENRLQDLEGIGPALAAKIKEIVMTGKLAMLERLETAELPLVPTNRSILLAAALTFCADLLPTLEELPGVKQAQVTGLVRRRQETVSSLEFVLAVSSIEQAQKALAAVPQLHQQQWQGNMCTAVHAYGVEITLYLTAAETFIQELWQTTGSAQHVRKVAALIKDKSGYDLLAAAAGKPQHSFASEAEIYALAGLPEIVPELREDRGEVEAAQAGQLPRLIEAADYKGDLHVHTNWSDGTASIEKMAAAAAELGYEYLAITDHSQSLKVAHGLSPDRLKEQIAFIHSLQNKYNLRIFAGIEADILDDGSVDAPDEVLAQLDIVVASVHSGFKQSREKITRRICRALQNPYVHILGHATGRLLGKRDPYEVNMGEVLRTAAAAGTALEINSSPDRLDISDQVARQAKAAGAAVAVNTDAHSQLELSNVSLGLAMARRGWLEKADVLNTYAAQDLLTVLHNKNKQRR